MSDLRTTITGVSGRMQGASWVVHSRRRALLVSIAAGVAVFCAAFFAERYLYHQGVHTLAMVAASNALAALLACLFILRIFLRSIERRREIFARLEVMAEINHHIRNGLELIQLSTYNSEDQRALEAIRTGVERIEWALREMLGPAGPLGDRGERICVKDRDVA